MLPMMMMLGVDYQSGGASLSTLDQMRETILLKDCIAFCMLFYSSTPESVSQYPGGSVLK